MRRRFAASTKSNRLQQQRASVFLSLSGRCELWSSGCLLASFMFHQKGQIQIVFPVCTSPYVNWLVNWDARASGHSNTAPNKTFDRSALDDSSYVKHNNGTIGVCVCRWKHVSASGSRVVRKRRRRRPGEPKRRT